MFNIPTVPPTRTNPAGVHEPTPPPPSRDARAQLRASILPSGLGRVSALPAFAQALEEGTLRPVRLEDFYDLTSPPKAEELTAAQKKTLFRQSFFEEGVTLEELSPYRIRVAYRIVREILRLRGTHTDMPLIALAPNAQLADAWLSFRTAAPRHLTTSHAAASALPILDAADRLDPPGLPLLPPPVPQTPLTPYLPGNPEHDPRLHLYVNALETIAEYLGIPEGTKADPRLGRFGLLGLTNPLTIRLTFPSRLQLVQYERLLMQETLDLLTTHGRRATEAVLFEKYGFADDEILLLFKLSAQRARHMIVSSAEEDKAMMILRMEELLRRASNPRTELMILKAMSIVQGLGKIEPDDIHADLEKVYKKLEAVERGEPLPELPMD